MDKQKIIDYVLDTPTNTNPRILGQMLEEYATSGGETWNTVIEDSVTTENTDDGAMCIIEYASVIDADKIKVTFNGTEYECDKITAPVGNAYGGIGPNGPDFSEYPFGILSGQSLDTIQTVVYTETAGTYSLKIEEPQSGGSSDFSTVEVTLSAKGSLGSLPIASIIGDNIATNVPFFIKSFEAILYKGSQVCDVPEIMGTITVSGDAVYDSDKQTITITGDCTITIS